MKQPTFKQRAQNVVTHLRAQADEPKPDMQAEHDLWFSVLERAVYDLQRPREAMEGDPLEFITHSQILPLLGLNPQWVQRLLRQYALI